MGCFPGIKGQRKLRYTLLILLLISFAGLLWTQPSNNLCSGATVLSVEPAGSCTGTIGTNIGATPSGSTPDPTCGLFNNENDVWYSFSVPAGGSVTLKLNYIGSSNNWAMQTYSGSCGSLVLLECSQGVTFNVQILSGQTPGSTIYVRVWSVNSSYTGDFKICAIAPPDNDLCVNATVVPLEPYSCTSPGMTGYTLGATDSGEGIPCGSSTYSGRDIWYSFSTPGGVTEVFIEVIQESGSMYAAVYEASTALCGSLPSPVYCPSSLSTAFDEYISGLSGGTDYLLRIYNSSSFSSGSIEFCIYYIPPPLNNNCSDAVMVNVDLNSCTSGTTIGSNEGATDSGEGLPCGGGIYNGGDIWFGFTTPAGISAVFLDLLQTPGSLYVEVYEGSTADCGSLPAAVYCSNAISTSSDEYIPALTGNTDYLLRLFESGNNSLGTIEFCMYYIPPPPNDLCNGAIAVTVDSSSCNGANTIGTNEGATDSGEGTPCGLGNYNGGDLWYSFSTPPGISAVYLDLVQGPLALYGEVYQASVSDCGALPNPVLCSTAINYLSYNLIYGLAGEEDYLLRLFEDGHDDFTQIEFCLFYVNPPGNNSCTNVTLLSVGAPGICNSLPGTNFGATPSGETPLPSCGSFGSGADIWYSLVVPSSGKVNVEISDLNGPEDWVIQAYSGSCGSFVELGCDDNSGVDDFPLLKLTGQSPGTTIYIRVWESENNATGAFNICAYEPSPPPINDLCPNATSLVVGGPGICSNITGTNISASASGETPIPDCGSFGNGTDSWYSVIVPGNGKVTIEMNDNGGPQDWVMQAYTGNCGALVLLECDDNDGIGDFPKIELTGQTPGSTIYLRIFEWGNDDPGDYSICAFEPPPPPPNDLCTGAIAVVVDIDTCSSGTMLGTNLGTTDSGEGTPCGHGTYSGGDIWYSFTTPVGITAVYVDVLQAPGSLYGTVYQASAASCGALPTAVYCANYFSTSGDEYIPDLTGGTDYLLRFFESGNDATGTIEFCIYYIPPPPNDFCIDAQELTVGGVGICTNTLGTNVGATASGETPDPTCGLFGFSTEIDVWYKLAVPSSGNVTIVMSDAGGPTDWAMQAYTGTCGSLSLLECDDNDGPGTFPRLDLIGQVPGSIIYIRVYISDFILPAPGEFNICAYDTPPPPSNDLCVNAIPVTVDLNACSNSTTLGTNESATDSGEGPPCGSGVYQGGDIWYSFSTPPGISAVYIDMIQAPGLIYAEVYEGTTTSCGALPAAVYCSDVIVTSVDKMIYGLTGSTNYLLRLFESFNDEIGAIEFCIYYIPPPVNDLCSNALPLAVGNTGICNPIIGSNTGATPSGLTPEPDCGSFGIGSDVWYSVIIPSGGNVSIEMNYASGPSDWVMQAYSGTCGSLGLLDCDDNNGPGLFPRLDLTGLSTGSTLLIRIWESGSNASGDFNICAFEPLPPPVNNLCAGAVALSLGGPDMCNSIQGTNESATASGELPEPSCGVLNAGEDVWYSITIPAGGEISILVSDVSGFSNWVMQAYTGQCGSLSLFECDDNDGPGNDPFLELTGQTPGSTIYIRVFESGNDDPGDFEICVYLPSCPPSLFLTGTNSGDGSDANNVADNESNGNISSTQIISGSVTIYYDSATDIDLLPGFQIVFGAIFEAFIDGCFGAAADGDDTKEEK